MTIKTSIKYQVATYAPTVYTIIKDKIPPDCLIPDIPKMINDIVGASYSITPLQGHEEIIESLIRLEKEVQGL